MKSVFLLLLCFLGIGLVAHTYNARTRRVIIAVIAVVLLYISLS